jgi:hypothetical protein
LRLDWYGASRTWLITAFDHSVPRRTKKSMTSLDDLLTGRLSLRPRRDADDMGSLAPDNKAPDGWGTVEPDPDQPHINPEAVRIALEAVRAIVGPAARVEVRGSLGDPTGRVRDVGGLTIGPLIRVAVGPRTIRYRGESAHSGGSVLSAWRRTQAWRRAGGATDSCASPSMDGTLSVADAHRRHRGLWAHRFVCLRPVGG